MPRLSAMAEVALGAVTDNDRIGYLDVDGPTDYVATVGVLRQAMSSPSTDHSGSLGDSTHRWLAAHADVLTLYGTGSVVADTPIIVGTQTWNNAAVAFTLFRGNATDTASAAGAKLIDLQVNNVSRFSVSKAGAVACASIVATGTIAAATFSGGLDAGTLTGATLAANVLASSLTSLGTVAALVATKAVSASASVSALNNTATDAVTLTGDGVYLAAATYAGISQHVVYVISIVGSTATLSAALVGGGSGVSLTVSGGKIRVTQTSGITQTVSCFAFRISA